MPKPHRRAFERALAGLQARPEAAAHVGDLHFTDVAGARAMGMLTIRFRGQYDDQDGPEAELVIDRLTDLPAAIGLTAN